MRYFFTRRIPDAARILLVESGSRSLYENLIGSLRATYGSDIRVDLVTCYAGLPEGFFPETTTVYRVSDYRGSDGRKRLFRELSLNGYSFIGIICSDEPIMTKWKWVLAARVPAKVFILNENGDYFWLDIGNLGIVRHFLLFRAGLVGAGAVRTLGRLLLFPFTLAYLLLYASVVHSRRALRKGF